MTRRVLAALLGLLSLANLARMVLSIGQAQSAPDLPVAFRPELSAVMGGVWAAVFGAAAVAVAGRRSAYLGAAAVAGYHAHLWLNRAVFARSEEAWVTTGFNLLLTAIAVGAAAALAWWAERRGARRRPR